MLPDQGLQAGPARCLTPSWAAAQTHGSCLRLVLDVDVTSPSPGLPRARPLPSLLAAHPDL